MRRSGASPSRRPAGDAARDRSTGGGLDNERGLQRVDVRQSGRRRGPRLREAEELQGVAVLALEAGQVPRPRGAPHQAHVPLPVVDPGGAGAVVEALEGGGVLAGEGPLPLGVVHARLGLHRRGLGEHPVQVCAVAGGPRLARLVDESVVGVGADAGGVHEGRQERRGVLRELPRKVARVAGEERVREYQAETRGVVHARGVRGLGVVGLDVGRAVLEQVVHDDPVREFMVHDTVEDARDEGEGFVPDRAHHHGHPGVRPGADQVQRRAGQDSPVDHRQPGQEVVAPPARRLEVEEVPRHRAHLREHLGGLVAQAFELVVEPPEAPDSVGG
mmetsp:Transcript_16724/g.47590  ORF Transcript_16724/g.47590 Transcript_16724/m.47590 type:complete len:331 (+) Transcript_16724:203-1195(+)